MLEENVLFIDAKGLKCPMPVIKLQQAVRKAQAGAQIQIACTDKGAENDIGSWARVNKHSITEIHPTDYGLLITLRIKETAA
ncbi:UPF0033 protein YrkI [Thiosulfatimonas sediminis]|uniref:UPF0033 protein YrkI n=1 Tax=Thiosulfatimonas sediminis TaxID=2675054 RepID=A0A6F8PSG9_9GAMM|nr:sulfurtransferase TusA family protein [Thiosulfatimonas sediminis]BBP44977.1 UPF0033 protein YrkI [Thiosulfatimonas sediminis]